MSLREIHARSLVYSASPVGNIIKTRGPMRYSLVWVCFVELAGYSRREIGVTLPFGSDGIDCYRLCHARGFDVQQLPLIGCKWYLRRKVVKIRCMSEDRQIPEFVSVVPELLAGQFPAHKCLITERLRNPY